MKKIPITQGKFAIVDDADFVYLSRFKWSLDNGRAITMMSGERRHSFSPCSVPMERFLIKSVGTRPVLHRNNDHLDYRSENLYVGDFGIKKHICPKQKNTSSIYKGVCFNKQGKDWLVSIRRTGKQLYLGRYKTEEEAAIVWNKKARELYGEFAYQNKIENGT